MIDGTDADIVEQVRREYLAHNINAGSVLVRRYPGETIVIVEVGPESYHDAVELASKLDQEIANGFITVRRSTSVVQDESRRSKIESLSDIRVNSFVNLLNSRSRTSESQPSLKYVTDAGLNLNIVVSQRHNLIFGRRGVGKTALMLEAKRIAEQRGAWSLWLNCQTIRSLSAHIAFLNMALRLCELPQVIHGGRTIKPKSIVRSEEIKSKIERLLAKPRTTPEEVHRLLPEIHGLLQLLTVEAQKDIYLFLDDFHYLRIQEQPAFLDMVHSVTRDNPVWIKAAAIRHQARWFTDNPPTGLQTGHDAALVPLDVTLEQPGKAKQFLVSIIKTYAEEASIGKVTHVISPTALDRLVLASGGVPRDFLVLASTSIGVARSRANAKTVGVQDVNEAAGKLAQVKIQELEDDAASSIGKADSRTAVLNIIRKFLLETQRITFFRVDFRDKELHADEYDRLQGLMDLRLIHLIHAGLSDERQAGQRSEVYMLDLSQFSGTRFRQNLVVLDLTNGYLVQKKTRGGSESRKGDTSRRLQGILRRGPLFELSSLSDNPATITSTPNDV